jgi:hypothetical protein
MSSSTESTRLIVDARWLPRCKEHVTGIVKTIGKTKIRGKTIVINKVPPLSKPKVKKPKLIKNMKKP